MHRVSLSQTQERVVRWWWLSGRNQKGLHGGSDLGLFFKAFGFGLKIILNSGAKLSGYKKTEIIKQIIESTNKPYMGAEK